MEYNPCRFVQNIYSKFHCFADLTMCYEFYHKIYLSNVLCVVLGRHTILSLHINIDKTQNKKCTMCVI